MAWKKLHLLLVSLDRLITVVAKTYWYKKKVPSISLTEKAKGTMGVSKFIGIEIISQALLKMPPWSHSQFCPIWWVFVPVYHRLSKRAWVMISIPMNFDTLMVPVVFSVNEMLGTFFLYQYVFATTVCHAYLYFKVFIR